MYKDDKISKNSLPVDDLSGIWDESFYLLNNNNILITGASGFIGSWLVESLLFFRKSYELNISLSILTRSKTSYLKKYPFIEKEKNFFIYEGNVINWVPPYGLFPDLIIHAATDASARLNEENPFLMFETIVGGTRNMLDLACRASSKAFLMISSGATYGSPQNRMIKFSENDLYGPDTTDPFFIYGESKRMAEILCSTIAKSFPIRIPVVRLFAFVGPRLPLDQHFAIGNFIHDALSHRSIKINGDGTPVRSYMYVGDLVKWLIKILLQGKSNNIYNVGSDEQISILDLANTIAEFFTPKRQVEIKNIPRGSNPLNWYVPSIEKAKNEFGLSIETSLKDAVFKTIKWYEREING